MRLGVIITCRNYGDLVCRAINSAIDQPYENVEVVVVDDASSDHSRKAIDAEVSSWQDDPVDIHTLHLDRRMGPSHAKNQALRLLYDRVDAFAFLDADDRYEPEYLAEAAGVLSSDRRIGLVYCDHLVDDRVQGVAYRDYKAPYDPWLARQIDVVGGNFVVAKHALAFAGPFDESLPVCENFEFVHRVAKKFVPVHIPRCLVRTTISPRSLRASVPGANWLAYRDQIVKR
jgi:glycosyltransferase involved in cell wall biosynthesis